MIDRGLLNYPEQLAVRLSKMERDIKRNAGKPSNCSGGGNATANITTPTYTTLWTNSNLSQSFAAQTINISNLSSYNFIEILSIPHRLGDQAIIKVERHYYDTTRKKGSISDVFWYNNNRYYGYRGYTVNAGNIVFDNAKNDVNVNDNDWYVPLKIIGYKF